MNSNKIPEAEDKKATKVDFKNTPRPAAGNYHKMDEETAEALKESETLFRHAFDLASTGMCVVDFDGKLQKTNAAFSRLLGFSAEELKQLLINEITHTEDLGIGIEDLQKLRNGEIETTGFEKRYVAKNKTIISAYVSTSLVRDDQKRPKCFITQLVDLTSHTLVENKMKENEKLYETFMNSTSDIAYVKDDQLRYVMTNRKQQEFFGRTDDEICGKTDYELMPPENAASCQLTDIKVLELLKITINTEAFNDKIFETRKFPVRLKDNKIGIGAFIRDVTEQINGEKELQKLSQVVQQSPASIIVTNIEGKIEYVNSAACRYTGYSADELTGNNLSMLSYGDTAKDESKILWKTIKSGNEWKGEFRSRKKSGEQFWESSSISPIKNQNGEISHFLNVRTDITERKQSELIQTVLFNISKRAFETNDINHLLEIVKDELSAIVDTSNFYVAFYDEDTDMLTSAYVDDEKDSIISWSAEKSLTGYVVHHNKSLLLKHDDFIKLIETGEVELVGTDSEIWLGVPLTVNGKPFGAIVVQDYYNPNAYNENELKMLEFIASQISLSIQRQKSIIELHQALIKAEAGDRLKTAFINNISHEIRTPLNGILGFSEMTIEKDTTAEDHEIFHNAIKKSSKRLLNTITSYMDIAMLVSGTMEVSRHPSNLEKVCEEIYNDFLEVCKLKGLELNLLKDDTNDTLILNTDIEKLRKIVTHLLDNAIKFTSKGSITFGFEKHDEHLEFYISDTGSGIKPEAVNIIFDPFMQADVSSTRGYEGSGLGLSIASGMVKLMGGTLKFDSKRGIGSRFYFTLPFDENPVATIRKINETQKTEHTPNPLILVAEDDDSNYKYIEIVLLYASYQVIRAENGMQAVEYCRNNPEIQLVLMDIKMPSMDGFEATRQIRKFMPELPVIALTAHVTTEDEKAAIAAGCNEYVSKPVSKAKLLEIIKYSLA